MHHPLQLEAEVAEKMGKAASLAAEAVALRNTNAAAVADSEELLRTIQGEAEDEQRWVGGLGARTCCFGGEGVLEDLRKQPVS